LLLAQAPAKLTGRTATHAFPTATAISSAARSHHPPRGVGSERDAGWKDIAWRATGHAFKDTHRTHDQER
jgi:hypothetical protein